MQPIQLTYERFDFRHGQVYLKPYDHPKFWTNDFALRLMRYSPTVVKNTSHSRKISHKDYLK